MFFLPVVDTLEVMSVITSVMFGTVLENDGLESAGLESAIVIADFVTDRVAEFATSLFYDQYCDVALHWPCFASRSMAHSRRGFTENKMKIVSKIVSKVDRI